MGRIDIERIAKNFDLIIVRSDYGVYNQWKNALVRLYVDDNYNRGYILEALDYDVNPAYNNIHLPAGIGGINGIRKFLGCRLIFNDAFNERWLIEELNGLLTLYRMHKDGE